MKWQKYSVLRKKCSGTSNLNFTFSLCSAFFVKVEVMEVGVIATLKNQEGNLNKVGWWSILDLPGECSPPI